MKIICDSCGAKYTVSDDKVKGKTVKVKCRKCSAVIVVSASGDVSTTGGSAGGDDGVAQETFTVSVTDADQRTMTMGEIVEAYNEGIIDADTFIWAEGMNDWQPLKEVDAIVDALHHAAEAEPAEPEPHAPGGLPDLASTVAIPEGYDPEQLMAAAAAAAPARTPAPAALGGGAPSPLPAAATSPSPTGGGFGGFGGFGGGLAAASPSTGNSAGKGMGAENSAIFSLDMLTAQASSAEPSSSGGGFADSEDSGLIDLKALAAGMGGDSGGGGGIAAASAGGMFPLGAPPAHHHRPAPAPTMPSEPAAAPASSNKGIILGLGFAVVALAAGLVFIIMQKGPETGQATVPTVVTVVKTVEVETTPPPPPPGSTATAEADATAAASSSAAPKVATTTGRPPTTPTKQPPTTSGGTPPPPPTKQPPPPPARSCPCAPGDLVCQMEKCAG